MPGELLTSSEVAKLMRVDRSTVLKWVRDGHLPAIRTPGRHVRIKRADVERLMGEPKEHGDSTG
jgi:excisionase family DNA binding protein